MREAGELVDIPVVGPAKTTLYMAATLANKFAVITAAGDLPKHIWAHAKLLGVVDRVVGIPTLKCTVADFLHDEDNAVAMIVAMGRRLMDDQGAEALVLGGISRYRLHWEWKRSVRGGSHVKSCRDSCVYSVFGSKHPIFSEN